MYCHPGTGVDVSNMKNYTTPQPCFESMYCPEGSADPTGSGECPAGFYCPFGEKISCPVGTYCPRDGHWDPLPCPPGTFSGQVSMTKCTACPRGFICPGFGRLAPAICPPGYVCSKPLLKSPNLMCPAGFYCQNGTATVDPFRNDTTLRPYPCSPGTYCLSGVGFNEVKQGDYRYAQSCTKGFFCESASGNPRGSGLCPLGFKCPLGTAAPIPAPRGFHAKRKGTIDATTCLPGFYAPTIQAIDCFPCPPGTACESEGLAVATLCPPGTYRGANSQDTQCSACPQGTWSKNYGLRETGECMKCPTGMQCSVESMTRPCSHADLPTPFEPVVNYQGNPHLEYKFPVFNMPPAFLPYECLRLNQGYSEGRMDPLFQEYFYGELVPPYIDVLGRGPHFRATDDGNTRWHRFTYSALGVLRVAKCYRNRQRFGSPTYQRISEYYGPQFDIQNWGQNSQGYSKIDGSFDTYLNGAGSLYIDLPKARRYEPSFNCTKGFKLMNEERVVYDDVGATQTVYTDPTNDPAGISREIPIGEDILYPGSCEADIICYSAVKAIDESEGAPCQEGFVCDEATSSERSIHYECKAGYVCGFGTTPDATLLAPMGQFRKLCPAGYVCNDGTELGQAYNALCPAAAPNYYFCPTGTGNVLLGTAANDAVSRGLSKEQIDPYREEIHVRLTENDDIRVISTHDSYCFSGSDVDLSIRYLSERIPISEDGTDPELKLQNPFLQFLNTYVPGWAFHKMATDPENGQTD